MKAKKGKYLLGWFLLCPFLLLSGCDLPTHSAPLSRTQFVLGTVVSLTLYDGQSEALLDEAFARLTELEKSFSINEGGTLLDAVNQSAGKKPVAVDADTFSVVQKGLAYSLLTQGAFDLTIGPLTQLWHIGFEDAKVPTPDEINARLPLVDYHLVQLNEEAQTIYLEKEGMALDLGGIGKGYAADKVAQLFREHGVSCALINLGGNVCTLGNRPDGKPWTIGIQDPFKPRGQIMGTITVTDCSLVTSGIYERYVADANGHLYHHILNPLTGYPYENEIASVTIICSHGIDGDALSTSSFALGIEEGLRFIEALPDTEALFISKDGQLFMTSGIQGQFTLTNPHFSIHP